MLEVRCRWDLGTRPRKLCYLGYDNLNMNDGW